MYRIYKINDSTVVDFAAEELKKYMRMMMPECGEIVIKRQLDATEGFRLGLMSDFGLDTSEAEDIELDDIIHIDTTADGGIIAGSNPRSVLLAVYRYLQENGCRWLYPGIDGEFIPTQDVKATYYHKMADCRHRGQCNEGAEFQQNMMETIDFTPKIGLNVYMLEFTNPNYYAHYYDRTSNPAREAEYLSPETRLQWKRQCEAEIAKRGLQFHDMGHGWTCEPFGIEGVDKPDVPEDAYQYLALCEGKRGLYRFLGENRAMHLNCGKPVKCLYYCAVGKLKHLFNGVAFYKLGSHRRGRDSRSASECLELTINDYVVLYLEIHLHNISALSVTYRSDTVCILYFTDVAGIHEMIHYLFTVLHLINLSYLRHSPKEDSYF